jgi:primosomal protein N'
MYIVTVIPIQKGINKENLTYFYSSEIKIGSIVLVPIRKRNIDAIVIDIEEVKNLKSEIKEKDYQIKKILKVKGDSPFTKSFFLACEKMKDYTISSTGLIINNLLPTTFLNNINLLKDIRKIEPSKTLLYENYSPTEQEKIKQEKLIFQALTPDRFAFYRTLIRESFAKKESVFICVPTRYDIEIFKEALTKGIESYVFTFHSDISKKNIIERYNEVISTEHPIIIIGTGMFLSIPREDIKTIILEKESSDSYKQYSRPFIDIRSFVEVLSSVNKTKLILGDTILRPETLYRNEIGELGEVASPLFRLPQPERQLVVNMKDESNNKKFTIISETTKDMIEYAISRNESVVLFSIRKGLAPLTVCNDCGSSILCSNCSNPMVLYGAKQDNTNKSTNSGRIFMCNKCGKKESTMTRCQNCSSWNLVPLGIGTDRVYEEIRNLFPNTNIIQFDKENISNEKEALAKIDDFKKLPGSILIGTEMIFSYLNEQVIHSAIISIDGLLSIPSFNITQKIIHIIERLQYLTERNLIIQTRSEDSPILRHILTGNVLYLYREDLKERKVFGYPPFKRLIKISFTGNSKETEKAHEYINKILEKYEPQIFSAFSNKARGQYTTNTIIKVDTSKWPIPSGTKELDLDLKENLSKLGNFFSINVDPEDLL